MDWLSRGQSIHFQSFQASFIFRKEMPTSIIFKSFEKIIGDERDEKIYMKP